jgi:hypothetical protein
MRFPGAVPQRDNTCVGPNPQSTRAADEQPDDRCAGKCPGVLRTKNLESKAVEPRQAVERPHPKEAIRSLRDGGRRGLRKSLLRGPGVHRKAWRGSNLHRMRMHAGRADSDEHKRRQSQCADCLHPMAQPYRETLHTQLESDSFGCLFAIRLCNLLTFCRILSQAGISNPDSWTRQRRLTRED